MPDMNASSTPRRRACIIGAGVSGLVAAKIFLTRGREVVLIEKSGEIGGVWSPSKSYPGVRTQTPRDLYRFTDFPMPASYPEWPTGPQVHAYLQAYAERFALIGHIRFHTEVRNLARPQAGRGWNVVLADANGEHVEFFDEVLVCTGQFSQPKTLDLRGCDRFAAGGGVVMHSSAWHDDNAATGQDVVIVGYSKSATDIAMQALAAKARSVTLLVREPSWKIPYFFGNLINFKNILYSRVSEAMFMPWAPSRAGRLARKLSAPLIWANWRGLEALLELQFKLKRNKLRPSGPIEESIHCATSIETPGFFKAVGRGQIRCLRGTVTEAEPGNLTTSGGESIPASLLILAIGWKQEVPFLDPQAQSWLIGPDGQYRLYRLIVNPDLPDLGFIGFNSSFITTLSAELSAHWLVRWFDRRLHRMANAESMHAEIEKVATWKRTTRAVASTFGGLCVAPYHFAHFDELMKDMGAKHKPGRAVAAYLLPINPRHYAGLLATAPDDIPAAQEPAR